MVRLPTCRSAAVAAALVSALAAPAAARAATIVVSIRHDVVANDGRCSLREAVSAANANARSGSASGECAAGEAAPAVDVIRLKRGKYKLTLGGPGDDHNLGGDLDVTGPLAIEGKDRTMIRNAVGDPAVRGDGDRLFHVDPTGAGGVDVTFSSVKLTKGDVGCTGQLCRTGASAVEANGDGALAFDDSAVLDNFAGCDGPSCGDLDHGAAIRTVAGGTLTIRGSAIRANRTRCTGAECSAGDAAIVMSSETAPGDLTIEDTLFHGNASSCEGDGCAPGGVISAGARAVAVRRVTFADNLVTCTGSPCRHDNGFALFSTAGALLEEVAVRDNRFSCDGSGCQGATLLQVQGGAGDAVQVRDLVAERNDLSCSGVACRIGAHVDLVAAGGDVVAEALRLEAVASACRGDSCNVAVPLEVRAGGIASLADAAVRDARSSCDGDSCRTEGFVELRADDVDVVRSEASGNVVSCTGAACRAGTVLDASTDGNVTFADLAVVDNRLTCDGDACVTAQLVDIFTETGRVALEETALEANEASCAGAHCVARAALNAASGDRVRFAGSRLTDGTLRCAGVECTVGEMLLFDVAGIVAFTDGTVSRNVASCDGSACRGAPIVAVLADTAAIADSQLRDNRSECTGAGCTGGFGGALHNAARTLTVTDTAVTGNRSDGIGAGLYNAPGKELVLQRVALVGNQVGLRGTGILGGAGGAIYNDAAFGGSALLRVLNSTILGNAASVAGGGILNEGVISTFAGSQLQGNDPQDCLSVAGGVGC